MELPNRDLQADRVSSTKLRPVNEHTDSQNIVNLQCKYHLRLERLLEGMVPSPFSLSGCHLLSDADNLNSSPPAVPKIS